MGFIVGLDLGQTTDFSALCVLQRDEQPGPDGKTPAAHYAAVGLKRWPLGTSYTAIVKDTTELLARPELQGAVLVVDASGVGRPVVDLLRQADLPAQLVPVVITGGQNESTGEDGYRHVAKVVLISATQVVLQQRRVKFAKGMPETKLLVRELENYRVKITAAANETFDAREREHDDLVLALCLAVWWAEKSPPWGADAFTASDPGESVYARMPKEPGYREVAMRNDPYAPPFPDDYPDAGAVSWPGRS